MENVSVSGIIEINEIYEKIKNDDKLKEKLISSEGNKKNCLSWCWYWN